MTATPRRTTRQSARNASRSTTTLEGAKESRNETIPPGKKVIKPRKSKAKKIPANAARTENVTVRTTHADSDDQPWYHFFTKGDEEYNHYMATEWGFEKRGMIPLFEKMSLEGAQSGLSWLTVLRKRDAYRRVFHGFNVDKVAAMTPEDVDRILAEEDKANPRNIVVRHRGKIESVINNAQCIQKLLKDQPNKPDYWDEFLWSFVDDRPILNRSWNGSSLNNAMTQSKESIAMSKALKALGFRFVGPTTMYAMMQSCGMVIDHPVDSPEWHAALKRLEQRPGGFQDQSFG